MSISSVLLRTHDFDFHYTLFIFLLHFTFCVLLTTYYFYKFHCTFANALPYFTFTFHKQTTPKKGRDIISDIFNIVLNRAFWRQNYNHF